MIRMMALGWWPVVVLVFMPRRLFLVPMIPLTIGAFRSRHKGSCVLVLVNALLVIGLFMGFSLPVGRRIASDPIGPRVRIMTFNQGGARLDPAALMRYLDRHEVNIVCFQELGSNSWLDELLAKEGWFLDQDRRIACRFPIETDLGLSTDRNRSDFQ